MKRTLCGLLACAALALCGMAAEKPKDKGYDASAPDAPAALEFANTWAQNGPYSLENLKGKIVVIYFYVDT